MNPFKNDVKIHLQSLASKKNVKMLKDGTVEARGGTGESSTWKVMVDNVGSRIRLRNKKFEKKFLRIGPNGILGSGDGGQFCVFQVVLHPNNAISLASLKHINKYPNWHVGFFEDGAPKPARVTRTGLHGRFKVVSTMKKKKKKKKKNIPVPLPIPTKIIEPIRDGDQKNISGSFGLKNKRYGLMFAAETDLSDGDHYVEAYDSNRSAVERDKEVFEFHGQFVFNKLYGQMFAADGDKSGTDHYVECNKNENPNKPNTAGKYNWKFYENGDGCYFRIMNDAYGQLFVAETDLSGKDHYVECNPNSKGTGTEKEDKYLWKLAK